MAGRPAVRRLAGPPRLPLRALRRADRAEGHPRRRPGAGRRRVGRGARRGPAGRARGDHRPGGAAAAAAHHVRAGARTSRERRSHGDSDRGGMLTQSLRQLAGSHHRRPRLTMAATTSERRGRAARGLRVPVPTDAPESDGTVAWDATTIVVVEAHAGGVVGLGYTYGDAATAVLVRDTLAPLVDGQRRPRRPGARGTMVARACRNLGRPGSPRWRSRPSTPRSGTSRRGCSTCRSCTLLGAARDAVPVYGSGGFTLATPTSELAEQLARLGRARASRA